MISVSECRRSVVWCLAGVALLLLQQANLSAEESVAPDRQPGYLVLANGSVLQGVVSLEGDRYRVALAKGEFSLAATQVDFFCKSLEEAYVRRKERLGGDSFDTHLEMARWCLQQRLFDLAAKELEAARQIESQHPDLELLERQIEQNRILATQQQAVGSAANQSADQARLPKAGPTSTKHAAVPQWARVEFVKRIQPLLLHSCTASGCHMPGSLQSWQIDRRALDGSGNPDLIEANLQGVLAESDTGTPENSPLLLRASASHGVVGQSESRALMPRQLAILRAWISQIRDQPIQETESHTGNAVIPAETVRTAADPFDPSSFNRHTATPETDADSDDLISPPAAP